jgi:hypothetical protein
VQPLQQRRHLGHRKALQGCCRRRQHGRSFRPALPQHAAKDSTRAQGPHRAGGGVLQTHTATTAQHRDAPESDEPFVHADGCLLTIKLARVSWLEAAEAFVHALYAVVVEQQARCRFGADAADSGDAVGGIAWSSTAGRQVLGGSCVEECRVFPAGHAAQPHLRGP